MAKRRESRRSRLRYIVAVLVLAVVALCLYSSWNEKNGGGLLPAFDLGLPAFVEDFLDDIGGYGEDRGQSAAPTDPSAAALEVHFLDVGQAESILIKAPRANVLIDAGENNQGGDVLRYLRSQGVKQLDYVIGTHPHSDHIGGLDDVILEMKVKNVILPVIPEEIAPTTQTYLDLLEAIDRKGLEITPAKPRKSFDLGEGAVLEIVGPVGQYNDLNNMSVVCRVVYGDTSFLFTGDVEKGAESDILDSGAAIRADVLGVGHHGSSTSTTDAFLQQVAPRIAVISCGLDNSYGHPHREVMERLEDRSIQILRTDLNGAVVVSSDGRSLSVSTEK